MAIGSGITEIPDSEEEPLTSSPDAVSGGATDKLCATPQLAVQGAQDMSQDVANPDQALTERVGNEATGNVNVDQENASINDQTSHSDQLMFDAQPVTTTQPQVIVKSCPDGAQAQYDTASTPDERDSLLPPLASLDPSTGPPFESDAGGAPAAEQHGIDSTGLTSKASKNTDVSMHDVNQNHPDHDSSSGLVGSNISQNHERQLDQGLFPPGDVKHDKSEAVIERGDVLLELNHPDEQLTDLMSISPTPETIATPTFGELRSMVRDSDSETKMRASTQASTMPLSRADNTTQRTEDVKTQEGIQNIDSMPVSQIMDSTLQNLEDPEPAPRMEAVSPTAVTETATSMLIEPSEAHQEPTTVIVPAAQSPSAHASNAMNGTGSKVDDQVNSQRATSPDDDKQSFDDPGSIETSMGEVLAGDKAVQQSEEPVVDAAKSNVLTTADKSEIMANLPSISDPQPHTSPSQSLPMLTPQEATLAELKAQKATLLASLATLPTIRMLIEENDSSDIDMSDNDGEPTEADLMAAVNKIVKDHIKLLHEYNELKDVGQGLMGLIAEQRGVRIVEVQDEFGIDAND